MVAGAVKIFFNCFWEIVRRHIKLLYLVYFINVLLIYVGSVVEWLKQWTDNQHGLGSKPTCAILLCPWERPFTALSRAWWS